MRVLGVCGSLQASSGNRALIERASVLAPPGITVTPYFELATLPHFNPDHEHDGNEAVARLRLAVSSHDALLIACPEYGHSLPGALKNAVDWLIGSGELERKRVAITAFTHAKDRGLLGLAALRQTLGAVSARVVGGEPIPRGPGSDEALLTLLGALAATEEG